MIIQTNHKLIIEKRRLVEKNTTKVICISVYPSLNLILMSTVMMIFNKNINSIQEIENAHEKEISYINIILYVSLNIL